MVLGLHPVLQKHIKNTYRKNKMTERTIYNCDSCLNDIQGERVTIRSSSIVGSTRLDLGLSDKDFCQQCSEGVEVLLKKTYQEIFNKLQGGNEG